MLEEHGFHHQKNKFRVEVSIRIPIPERELILKSIILETRDIPSKRTHVSLQSRGEELVLSIEAQDLVALRAALNSFLRFIDSVYRSIKVVSSLE
ncbi:MAG: KEOPS complex subunit Pcc1 [Nitrososphaerota archaeon]|nr:hypothetical protein [Candidatus Geocrenenecus dongiae]